MNKVASVLDVKIMYPISLRSRNFANVIVVNYNYLNFLYGLNVWRLMQFLHCSTSDEKREKT